MIYTDVHKYFSKYFITNNEFLKNKKQASYSFLE